MSFSFYQVDPVYSNFLRQSDPCIPHTSGQKVTRPFVGVSMNTVRKRFFVLNIFIINLELNFIKSVDNM